MSALTDTYVEVVACDLSDQEFETPCSITMDGGREECTQTAEWWAQFAAHCAQDETFDLLLCVEHYAFVTEGGEAVCRTCSAVVTFKDHLLRTERIRP